MCLVGILMSTTNMLDEKAITTTISLINLDHIKSVVSIGRCLDYKRHISYHSLLAYNAPNVIDHVNDVHDVVAALWWHTQGTIQSNDLSI